MKFQAPIVVPPKKKKHKANLILTFINGIGRNTKKARRFITKRKSKKEKTVTSLVAGGIVLFFCAICSISNGINKPSNGPTPTETNVNQNTMIARLVGTQNAKQTVIIATPNILPSLLPTLVIPSTTPIQTLPTQLMVISLGQQKKISNCKINGPYPDKGCTPGSVFNITNDQICVSGYSNSVRDVSEEEKNIIYNMYGIMDRTTGNYEIDHYVSLEIGGSNDISNLWPEAAIPVPGYKEKDKVENYLHDQVCSGKMTLDQAQQAEVTDWVSIFNQYLVSKITITPSFLGNPVVAQPTNSSNQKVCCKTCGSTSKACGNSCISLKDTCHKAPGCACQ